MDTRITFKADGEIEGFADTQEIYNNFMTATDALWWRDIPPLTNEFSMTTRVGTITKLEYRDGNLWCEATLNMADGHKFLSGGDFRFGVKCMLNDYKFVEREGEEELLVIERGELIEIGIIPLDGAKKTL